jgi:hypothetical protein
VLVKYANKPLKLRKPDAASLNTRVIGEGKLGPAVQADYILGNILLQTWADSKVARRNRRRSPRRLAFTHCSTHDARILDLLSLDVLLAAHDVMVTARTERVWSSCLRLFGHPSVAVGPIMKIGPTYGDEFTVNDASS